MTSLRRSLISAFSILLTVVGTAGALYAYRSALNEAWGILDLQQRQIARFIGDGDGLKNNAIVLPPHEDDEDFVVQVDFSDGRSTISSNPSITFPAAVASGFSEFEDAGKNWRLFTATDGLRTVRVAQQTAEREELAANAAWQSSLPFLVAIPLSWIVVYGLVGVILKRLNNIARHVARRSPLEATRIDITPAPEEVRPLISAMNDALQELQEMLQQQKQFVADAAHELRTPLTALTLQVNNLQSQNNDPALEEPVQALTDGVRRASKVTSQLLALARQESLQGRDAMKATALDQVVLSAVATLLPLAQEKGIDLGIGSCQSIQVQGSEQHLTTLIEILIDNAVRYTPKGGEVDVSLLYEFGEPIVTVTDTGPGIPDASLPRVFDRFYRVNESQGTGSGLGLSIARAIAERHGAGLILRNRADRNGTVAKVIFKAIRNSAAERPMTGKKQE